MSRESKIIAVIAIALFMTWSFLDTDLFNALYRPADVKAATGQATATLNVTVNSAITFSIYSGTTINFANLNPGTAVYGATVLLAVTNDTFTVTAGRDNAYGGTTLASAGDPTNVNISDSNGGIDAWNAITSCGTAAHAPFPWKAGTSTGLGFSLYKADNGKSTACWGTGVTKTDANNWYAALQASASAATFWQTTTSGTIYGSVGYILDAPSTQRATSYTGKVVYNATTTP